MADVGELLVPDLLEINVPVGSRILVASDLHLAQNADPSSEQVAAELARAVENGPEAGVVVLAGNTFELLTETHNDPSRALRSHGRLTAALASFAAGPGRRLIVLPGNHDGALAWHAPAVKSVVKELGAEVALAVDLLVETGSGERRVRVEHGHQLDKAAAFEDPRNPGETPLSHHLVRDVLPMAHNSGAAWLDGFELLTDPADAIPFIRSRLAYRQFAHRSSGLLFPYVIAAICGIVWLCAGHPHDWAVATLVAAGIGVGLVAAVLVGGLWWWWASRRPLASIRPAHIPGSRRNQNEEGLRRAGRLVGDGFAGYISGHTRMPELTDLGGGFYANCGCGGAVVERRPGRLSMPGAYAVGRRLSWVEMEAGADLHVELCWGRQALPSTTMLERLFTRPVEGGTPRPTVVASWPHGQQWPEPAAGDMERRETVRRRAAFVLGLAGLVDLLSAITPPGFHRIHYLTEAVPLAVPQTAAVLVVLAGIALLLLARGVRRGQRHAWGLAFGLLLATSLLHILKGLDGVESILALSSAIYLWAKRRHFNARVDEPSVVRGLLTLAGGAVAAVAAGLVGVLTISGGARPPFGQALLAVTERLVGIENVVLPARVDRFLEPTLLAASIGIAVSVGWLLFRPVVARSLAERPPESLDAARRAVEQYGGDTLAYFALRDDKRFFFWGDTMVAYGIHQGVCLVSPDPLGPKGEQREAWAAFRSFADDHGWPVAIMAAGETWLPIYRASGMHDLYIGDEAVVDVRRFDLSGGRNKGLRQAVNRIAKYGYTAEFHDPANLDAELERKLRLLMTESRRGEVERGFSMTLGRIFEPDDKGLLLTVCLGPDGEPAAFCQYVPSDAINGYSLDLMRRSEGEHPNGLTDFVVVETIRHLRDQGKVGLGLNFAVMRAVLAGERGDGSFPRIQKWFLQRLGDSMQIESLWRFNAKF
ncbi:MAG TPA: phosphatidylglycerol lysyltransferase domain-containing protein, partial [Acidimicrobiales bacterium]